MYIYIYVYTYVYIYIYTYTYIYIYICKSVLRSLLYHLSICWGKAADNCSYVGA